MRRKGCRLRLGLASRGCSRSMVAYKVVAGACSIMWQQVGDWRRPSRTNCEIQTMVEECKGFLRLIDHLVTDA